jgi:hypothetical protein
MNDKKKMRHLERKNWLEVYRIYNICVKRNRSSSSSVQTKEKKKRYLIYVKNRYSKEGNILSWEKNNTTERERKKNERIIRAGVNE